MIATTGDDAKAELLGGLGAAAVVNHRSTADWPAAVRELTGGQGADHVVDVAGTLGASLAATAFGGWLHLVGFVGGAPDPVDPYAVFTGGVTVRPVAVGSRAQLEELVRAVSANGLRPVVGRTFAFDRAREAFEHYFAGGAVGKVVITVDARPALRGRGSNDQVAAPGSRSPRT